MMALPERPVCAAMTTFSPIWTVVADMDEVVDFCAAADAGFVERAAVDGGVGADLYVVFDDQASDLRGLLVASGLRVAHVAEAFTAQDGARLNDDAVAECCARVDGDVGVDAAMAADYHVVADHANRRRWWFHRRP